MKFIITESNLEKVIFKYLDNKKFIVVDRGRKFNNYVYFLNSNDDEMAQISVYTHNAFGELRNWVYVTYYLIEEISVFFSISKFSSLNIIGEWVGQTLKIEPQKVTDARQEGNYRLIIDGTV